MHLVRFRRIFRCPKTCRSHVPKRPENMGNTCPQAAPEALNRGCLVCQDRPMATLSETNCSHPAVVARSLLSGDAAWTHRTKVDLGTSAKKAHGPGNQQGSRRIAIGQPSQRSSGAAPGAGCRPKFGQFWPMSAIRESRACGPREQDDNLAKDKARKRGFPERASIKKVGKLALQNGSAKS